jgi:multiple sugar transport system ATP-binding protein
VFVAGFIGSPAMNFIAGTVEDGTIRLPFGRVSVSDRVRAALEGRDGAREVVLGLRPEDLEPLAPDAGEAALRLPVVVDTVESTGADLYVHARVDGAHQDNGALDRLLTDDADTARSRARDGTSRVVARLDPASGATAGRHMTLGIATEHLYVFDAATGDALAGAERDPVEAAPQSRSSRSARPGSRSMRRGAARKANRETLTPAIPRSPSRSFGSEST